MPDYIAERLLKNERGWVVPGENEVAEPSATYNNTAQNWPEIVADLAAKVGEQNSQIDRLLTIVEQLTAGKK
jgi:predicted lipoprotein with Yx(FWY)xxD motif